MATLLLFLALVCFVVTIFYTHPRFSILSLGFALWVASILFGGHHFV